MKKSTLKDPLSNINNEVESKVEFCHDAKWSPPVTESREPLESDVDNRFDAIPLKVEAVCETQWLQSSFGVIEDPNDVDNIRVMSQEIVRLKDQRSKIAGHWEHQHILEENKRLVCENAELKANVKSMEKEVDNLRLNYKKVNFEGMKLRKANELLKQSQKSVDIVLKSLKKELQEYRDKAKVVGSVSKSGDERLLNEIVVTFSDDTIATARLRTIYKKHNRSQMFEPVVKVDKKSPQEQKYASLKAYENMFEDSDQDEAEIGSKKNVSSDRSSSNKKGLTIHAVIASDREAGPIRFGEDRGYHSDVKYFPTNEVAIESNLNATEALHRISFSSQTTGKVEVGGPTFNLNDIILDLKSFKDPKAQDITITRLHLLEIIDAIQIYLASDKNSTSLKLTEHDKRKLLAKFDKKSFTQRAMAKAFMSVALEHINFLECHIKSLTNKNCDFEMKMSDMREEMNFMLKSFLDKNKETQEFLNASVIKFKLSKLERKTSVLTNQSAIKKNMNDYSGFRRSAVTEIVALEGQKMGPDLEDSPKEVYKRNVSRFKKQNKVKFTSPENKKKYGSAGSEDSDDNIWKKVTSFFTVNK